MKLKILIFQFLLIPLILSSQIISEDFESCTPAPDCDMDLYDAIGDECFDNVLSLQGIPILVSSQCDYDNPCSVSAQPQLEPIEGDGSIILYSNFGSNEASGLIFNVGEPLKYGSRLVFECTILNPISDQCLPIGVDGNYSIFFGTGFINNSSPYPQQSSYFDLHIGGFDNFTNFGDNFNTGFEEIKEETLKVQIEALNTYTMQGPFDQVLIVNDQGVGPPYVHIFDNITINCDMRCPMIETNVQPLINLDPNDNPSDLCGNIVEIDVALESRCNNLSLSDIPYKCTIKDSDTNLEITNFMSSSDYHRIVIPTEVENIEVAFEYGDNACLYPAFNNLDNLSIPKNPIELSGNTTNDMYFPNGAIVRSGTTATINNRLIFGTGKNLRIESGASVVLGNGAILTSCEGLWRGISMTANSSLSSSDGAVIEFATTGIAQRGQNFTCNNLNVTNTTFDGCGTGVFMSNSIPSNTNNSFSANTFINTNVGIRNRNLLELEILDNPRIECTENGYISFNGSATINGNIFGSSSIGINLNNIFNPMDQSVIQGNTFLPSCSIGIQIEGGSPNNGPIEISGLNWFQASDFGLVVIGNSAVDVVDNNFFDEKIAIRFIDSGFGRNLIESNDITNVGIGIAMESLNPSLRFLSNCFHNISTADSASEDDIDNILGGQLFGASNCYSQTAFFDFIFGGTYIEYYVPLNTPSTPTCLNPKDLVEQFKFNAQEAEDCDGPPGFILNDGVCIADNNILL